MPNFPSILGPRSRWLLAAAAVAAVAATAALGQADRWYPSRWGAADQRGAANELTPAKVLEAKNLIKTGTVYQLGRVYEIGDADVRHAALQPADSADVRADGLEQHDVPRRGHQRRARPDRHAVRRPRPPRHRRSLLQRQQSPRFREGRRACEARRRERRRNRDARSARSTCRHSRASQQLDGGYEITVADFTAALARQNVEIHAGDVVLFHTGWGSLWMKDNAKFNAGAPGHRPRRGAIPRRSPTS